MNNLSRRFVRLLVITLIGASFAACHFHGGHCGSYRSWCAPVRHCR